MARKRKRYTFVDAFAGCGGLSLGLTQAGLSGRFAIERHPDAFNTFKKNLLSSSKPPGRFCWPRWLPQEPIAIERLIRVYGKELARAKGTIDVLAGGPPCQGFSSAGRRRHDDPRNQLFRSYVQLVTALEPKIVLIENVRGFTMDFKDEDVGNYSDRLCKLLSKNYVVHQRLIDLSLLGVPQKRTRYFLIAVRPELRIDPFELLQTRLPTYLRGLGLQVPVSARSAISDLEIQRVGSQASIEAPGFMEICQGRKFTRYQKLMSQGTIATTDLRLARHADKIAVRFADIIKSCHRDGRLNTSVSEELRMRHGLRKQALRVLDPDGPSPTITSMPDDLLHYSEPRTLTVRENARLQGFPDWFEFAGKYTTGGDRRRYDVPRFTQVANAVPPLAAQAIGQVLIEILGMCPVAAPKAQSRFERTLEVPKFLPQFQEQSA